jgi:superfamily II DNA helicase RecQ
VDKATVLDRGVEAYYIDEHKAQNATTLKNRLMAYSQEEAESSTIIIFASPNALRSGSPWLPLLDRLAKKDLISMLAIDEAHEVHQSGRNFRPEFFDAVENMKKLYDVLPRPVPRLVMSATMTSEDIDVVTKNFGIDRYVMMCGSLARRQTLFRFRVSGNPAKSVVQLGADKLSAQPDKQQLWYCNSRTSAEGSMLDKAEGLLEKHFSMGNSQSTAQSFTGGDGLKMKVSIMDAFTSFADLPGEPVWNDDGTVTLAKIQILIATSAANCGISSNFLTSAMHKGFPYSLYDIVQEMGRVNRTQRIPNCSFEIHASFDCLLSTYIRIMSNEDATERSRLLDMLMEVLQFLVVPETCYHSFIEKYFEHGDFAAAEKPDCGNMCSACLKETLLGCSIRTN